LSTPRPEVSVVFPCLNERESVGICVKQVKGALEDAGLACEVIVADNGSTDGSDLEADAAGARVVHVERRGYGHAVVAGVEHAHGDVIVVADADGTYPMEEAPAFVAAARAEPVLVLGSRFAGKIMPGAMPILHRLVGSPATRLMLRFLLGVRSSDPHSGMRALRRTVFDAIRPSTGSWEFTVEMLVNASRLSVPVRELPIDYRARIGTSKLRAIPEGWKFFRFLVLHSPTFLFVVPGLAAMAVGSVAIAWLAMDDRTVGPINFGVNTLVLGALATILGYQLSTLGVCARAYSVARDRLATGTRGLIERHFTLERGLIVGGVLLVGGIALVASVGTRWLISDFARLPRSDHGLAIAGLTAGVVGMQTIFSSFFLSLISPDDAPSRDADRTG
jgi:hypothetical protein